MNVRKIVILLIILILTISLVACDYYIFYPDIAFYDGKIYHKDTTFHDYYEAYDEGNHGNVKGYFEEETDTNFAWVDEFQDNILRYYGVGGYQTYYYKNGFEFPKYDDVVIEEILLADWYTTMKYSLPQDMKLFDIIDKNVKKEIWHDALLQCKKCFFYGILRDYSSFYLGDYRVFLFEDGYYIGIIYPDTYRINDNDFEFKEAMICYKVKDIYQQVFADGISQFE